MKTRKLISAILTLMLGFLSLTSSFAAETNNISNIKSEQVVIEGKSYNFEYDFSEGINTVKVDGENESSTISFDSNNNNIYLDGRLIGTVENKDLSELSSEDEYISRGDNWRRIDHKKFVLDFVGTESAAVIAGIIAAACTFPVSGLIGGVSIITGVAGFCSFEYREYFNGDYKKPSYKHELDIYSDRSWGSYEKTLTYIQRESSQHI